MEVLSRILELLDEADVDFRRLEHDPTPTSEDSARVRGESLEIGGEAIVFKADEDFHILVISAACRLKSSRLKRTLGARKLRFATSDDPTSIVLLLSPNQSFICLIAAAISFFCASIIVFCTLRSSLKNLEISKI